MATSQLGMHIVQCTRCTQTLVFDPTSSVWCCYTCCIYWGSDNQWHGFPSRASVQSESQWPNSYPTQIVIEESTATPVKSYNTQNAGALRPVASDPIREASKIRRDPDSVPSYICDICGSSFTRKHNLDNHMMSHNDVRPHACRQPGCNSAFTRRWDRTRHEQACHPGAQFFD